MDGSNQEGARVANRLQVKVKFLDPLWREEPPEYATAFSAGLDLKACLDRDSVWIHPGERMAIGTGLALEIEQADVAGFVFSRSGLGTKQGLVVSQGVGVIDPDYRGEVIVSLLNTSRRSRPVYRGQHIAQLVFMPAYQAELFPVDELGETGRGSGGFGHSRH
jgi:dUTP pyrophosphatase